MKKINILLALTILLSLFSCNPSDPTPEQTTIGKGLLVLNEGSYSFANSSLTFYDPIADTVENNLFYRVNQSPIGDVGQSLCLSNGNLFIVVNGSNYIYAADAKTMKYQNKIGDFYSPREILLVSQNKAYVSDLMGTGLWIVDLVTMSHSGFIETGKPTESMVKVGDEVFVANWSNYYQPETQNNTIQVVDTECDSLVAEVQVGIEPNSLVVDNMNRIWVLCSGGYSGDGTPMLCCIDPATRQVVKRMEFSGSYPTCYPTSLAIDGTGTKLYFINSNLYSMSINDESLPTQAFAEAAQGSTFNKVKVDPSSGEVYVADVKDYMQNGEVFRYNSNGELVKSFSTGIIPGSMIFN